MHGETVKFPILSITTITLSTKMFICRSFRNWTLGPWIQTIWCNYLPERAV